MKKIISFIIGLTFFIVSSNAQSKYLSDIIVAKDSLSHKRGYAIISYNYWRYDTCLENDQICKYNTHTAGSVKVYQSNANITYEFRQHNNAGYQSEFPDNIFTYIFVR